MNKYAFERRLLTLHWADFGWMVGASVIVVGFIVALVFPTPAQAQGMWCAEDTNTVETLFLLGSNRPGADLAATQVVAERFDVAADRISLVSNGGTDFMGNVLGPFFFNVCVPTPPVEVQKVSKETFVETSAKGGLTGEQIAALLSLLESFGVEDSVVREVESILR